MVNKAVDKLVNDGVVTVDAGGVVRLTESAWVSMTTAAPVPAKPVNQNNRKSDKY